MEPLYCGLGPFFTFLGRGFFFWYALHLILSSLSCGRDKRLDPFMYSAIRLGSLFRSAERGTLFHTCVDGFVCLW